VPTDDATRARRDDAINRLGVIERAGDPGLSALTRIAAYISGARAAAVHIIDEEHQHRVAAVGAELGTHPREDSMCRLVVDDEQRIVCADATADPRFGYSSFVHGDAPVRFYASLPLRTTTDEVIGTLCTFDTVEHELDDEQLARLEDLADQVAAQIELTRIASDLGHLAAHDPLTGAVNRLVLADRLAQATARRRRHPGDIFLALLDVDDFKSINDVHGHAAGDTVLVEIARRLQTTMRAEDTIARIGGDEFVVLAELTPPVDAGDELCARIRASLQPPIEFVDDSRPVSVSVGCVLARPGEPLTDVLARADAAMYADKQASAAARR
jgi:diguanylate cyclase (GGDEF)-like protein